MAYATLSPQNKLSFTCPIFSVQAEMRSCVELRTQVWQGIRPGVRKGCQACMIAGKCPAAEVVRRMAHSAKNDADEYASSEPTVGKLSVSILERILNVIVTPTIMEQFSVPPTERHLIETARDRITAQLATAPAHGVKRKTSYDHDEPVKTPRKAKIKTPDMAAIAAQNAAMTGDLSAALNKE
jgi:hypothetical protein